MTIYVLCVRDPDASNDYTVDTVTDACTGVER